MKTDSELFTNSNWWWKVESFINNFELCGYFNNGNSILWHD